mmetsp:Transcript_117547/g.315169  ORF Transcript_117547/g.315169 Transcript_117547/m.315169 type:complete len:234 (-) Transcript_117547:306-1007(-)
MLWRDRGVVGADHHGRHPRQPVERHARLRRRVRQEAEVVRLAARPAGRAAAPAHRPAGGHEPPEGGGGRPQTPKDPRPQEAARQPEGCHRRPADRPRRRLRPQRAACWGIARHGGTGAQGLPGGALLERAQEMRRDPGLRRAVRRGRPVVWAGLVAGGRHAERAAAGGGQKVHHAPPRGGALRGGLRRRPAGAAAAGGGETPAGCRRAAAGGGGDAGPPTREGQQGLPRWERR